MSTWTDIVAISADDYVTVGLKSDGTIVVAGTNTNVRNWKDIALPGELTMTAPEQTGLTASAATVGPLTVVNSAAVFVGNAENP